MGPIAIESMRVFSWYPIVVVSRISIVFLPDTMSCHLIGGCKAWSWQPENALARFGSPDEGIAPVFLFLDRYSSIPNASQMIDSWTSVGQAASLLAMFLNYACPSCRSRGKQTRRRQPMEILVRSVPLMPLLISKPPCRKLLRAPVQAHRLSDLRRPEEIIPSLAC